MNITDLPIDIYHIIVAYLDPPDLIALCSTTRLLHDDDSIRLSPTYWSNITRRTFRVPRHPITEHDGRRWMQLYRRMRTQTEVYTWGNNDQGCLGGELEIIGRTPLAHGQPGRVPQFARARLSPRTVSWPQPLKISNVGVIADLQSGGWSTTVLNSKGQLTTVGLIDGSGFHRMASPVPHPLKYPEGYVQPEERYDAYTAISQFSSGRSHVLGLSDAGRIWSWDDTGRPGLHIKFLHVDLVESQNGDLSRRKGAVRKVVAGWARSSAYINGTGIIVWEPSNNAEIQGESDQSGVAGDGMLVLESWIVPGTNFLRAENRRGRSDEKQDMTHADIGQVVNWIVLEQYVLFVTHAGGLYVSIIPDANDANATMSSRSICLNPSTDDTPRTSHVLDIQGSFRSFAIFLQDDTVLLGDQDYLHSLLGTATTLDPNDADHAPVPLQTSSRKLRKIPALQHTGVLQLAFGDWHFHALHADGTISSYGHETSHCGALGLGHIGIVELRGVRGGRGEENFRDATLRKECMTHGRRVWFENEKQEWLVWCLEDRAPAETLGHVRAPPAEQIGPHARDPTRFARQWAWEADAQMEVSEWVERHLRRWEEVALMRVREEERLPAGTGDDDGLPAYFALSVSAAGWHSGALVLVNEAKAERVRQAYQVKPNGMAQRKGESDGSLLDMAKSFVASFTGSEEAARKRHKEPKWIWEDKSSEIADLPDALRTWKEVELIDL